MAKLKFDRSINIVLQAKEEVKVPKDEVWKVGLTGGNVQINNFNVTDYTARYAYVPGVLLGGGTSVLNYNPGQPCSLTGVAFKVIN